MFTFCSLCKRKARPGGDAPEQVLFGEKRLAAGFCHRVTIGDRDILGFAAEEAARDIDVDVLSVKRAFSRSGDPRPDACVIVARQFDVDEIEAAAYSSTIAQSTKPQLHPASI